MLDVLQTAGFNYVRTIMERTPDEYCDLLLNLDVFIDQTNTAARIDTIRLT